MPRKVVFIYNNTFGQYPILYEYCVNVSANGYEVYYIGTSEKDEEFVSPEGINVIHIDQARFKNAWQLASAINQFIKIIHSDIIHVFHFRWCFLLPILSGKSHQFVLDVRTLHVADSKGKHSPFTFLKNRLTWFECIFFGRAIALTTDIKKILSPTFKKIPVIPLGANTAKLQPEDKHIRRQKIRNDLDIKDSDKVFIYSGTLSPARKINIIIEAFSSASLADSLLIIAGDDKDDPRSIINLKNQAKGNNKIIFTGFISYDNLVNYYLASDVGLCYIPQTSYYDLQPPTKLFEYMAAGLVTVATATSANKAVIQNEVNGYICDDSVNSLKEAFKTAKEIPYRRSLEITGEAFKTVQHYSWEYIIKNYIIPYYESKH